MNKDSTSYDTYSSSGKNGSSSNEQIDLKSFCYFVKVSHKNIITFNCNYVYIKYFKHLFNFCVSKSFFYSTDDALLQKAFTDILNCCDIHFTYILNQSTF